MKKLTLGVLSALALAAGGAGIANAQSVPAGPLPGAGDSSKISNSNRETNSDYNHLVGSTGVKQTTDVKIQSKHKAVPATAADVKAGAAVRGTDGVQVGTVVSSDANSVVLDTGQSKISVPLMGFGKDDKGLLINMTSAHFAELAAQAHARSQAQASNPH
jgi:hypothetical protein